MQRKGSDSNTKKKERETAVSQRLITFVLSMYKQITSEQRYTISILLQQEMKKKDIAAAIKISQSTISRELKRNSGRRGSYNWETALGRKETLKMETGLSDSTYPNQLKWRTSASRKSATLCRKSTGDQEKH
jgi:hypothetical protein